MTPYFDVYFVQMLVATAFSDNDIDIFSLDDFAYPATDLFDPFFHCNGEFLFLLIGFFIPFNADIFGIKPSIPEICPFRCFSGIIRGSKLFS